MGVLVHCPIPALLTPDAPGILLTCSVTGAAAGLPWGPSMALPTCRMVSETVTAPPLAPGGALRQGRGGKEHVGYVPAGRSRYSAKGFLLILAQSRPPGYPVPDASVIPLISVRG